MGLLFNTPDTEQIIKKLNKQYDDKPPGLPNHRGDAIYYLDYVNYPSLWSVADKLSLYPGNNSNSPPARRWKCFLDYIDPLVDPDLKEPIGPILRREIAKACSDLNCEAIEFFAVPDTVVHVNLGNLGTGVMGKYSRIVTLFTLPAGQMGCP
ncbi:hypothetical protein LJ725_11475 [Reyranella aquatilis]|uniref:RES domain-containing protein n=1 Tax=Reyranella aquatilis TaxID=2035356 RepID=A0ABS8KU31_9HYPH|nr:hypothetical protein [Reyranella aquatilis]MCC8429589.1 hypothetical protein [Reyranella aquatilis]